MVKAPSLYLDRQSASSLGSAAPSTGLDRDGRKAEGLDYKEERKERSCSYSSLLSLTWCEEEVEQRQHKHRAQNVGRTEGVLLFYSSKRRVLLVDRGDRVNNGGQRVRGEWMDCEVQ